MSASVAPNSAASRITLSRQRIYIFPTRHGLMLGAMTMVILLGAINYDNALGYLLSFLLFGLFLIAILQTYRNLSGLSYIGADVKPVFAGAGAHFKLVFDNRGQWPRYSLVFAHWPPVRRHLWKRRPRPMPAFIPWLEANGIGSTQVVVPTSKRGWLALHQVQISSVFPLGILRAWAYFDEPTKCLVYPKPIGQLPLPRAGSATGAATGGMAQGDDDFAGFRPYQAGDPIRAISWKNLARQDTVLVKRFTSGGADQVCLRWTDSARLVDTEARLSQMCQWVVEADGAGIPYGLELPGVRVDPAFGSDHRHRCLSALSLYSE